jgi:transcriptional regulator with XRE-family HTH domain
VAPPVGERLAGSVARRALATFGADVARLRSDAGLPRTELARAAGIDQSYLARIELGAARPSSVVCARIAVALGADLSQRLYPNSGPIVRDRHQAPITEALLGSAHPRWRRYLEVSVRQPSRGWIDVALHDPTQRLLVAVEVQSELRRLEQLIRWSAAKADSLPSWEGWAHLGAVTVSRLLVVRDTRATRRVATDFRRLLGAAHPADPIDALDALTGTGTWPGPAILWAVRDTARPGSYRIVARR